MEQNSSHAFQPYDPSHASSAPFPPDDPSTLTTYEPTPPGTYDTSSAPYIQYRGSTPPDIEMMSIKSDSTSSEILRAIQEDIHSHREQASRDMSALKEQNQKDFRELKDQNRKDNKALRNEFTELKDVMVGFSKLVVKSTDSNAKLLASISDRLELIEKDGTELRKDCANLHQDNASLRDEVRQNQRRGELKKQQKADQMKAMFEGVAETVAKAVVLALAKTKGEDNHGSEGEDEDNDQKGPEDEGEDEDD